MYVAELDAGKTIEVDVQPGRQLYLVTIEGESWVYVRCGADVWDCT